MHFVDVQQGSKEFFLSAAAHTHTAMYQKTTHSFYRLQVKSNKTKNIN